MARAEDLLQIRRSQQHGLFRLMQVSSRESQIPAKPAVTLPLRERVAGSTYSELEHVRVEKSATLPRKMCGNVRQWLLRDETHSDGGRTAPTSRHCHGYGVPVIVAKLCSCVSRDTSARLEDRAELFAYYGLTQCPDTVALMDPAWPVVSKRSTMVACGTT